ncbi:EamA family transporter [archaeon]|jgi:multidrug transporter EmrE-like cation transporter|nr:EamA family transporter [archaeon]MBT4416831.1 EamA family transporter [archaeon]
MDKKKSLLLIVLSVFIVDSGQLLLKKGLLDLGALDFAGNLLGSFILAFTNPFVLSGLVLFFLSSFVWLIVLSKSNLSFAYPCLSLGYVIVSILSWFFFNESLSALRLVGLGVIFMGVYFMSRT